MRNLTEAYLYPGVGLLETTNLSVGRGTDSPFEVIGAPWIDADSFAKKLGAIGLQGVQFRPVAFTPTSSKYEGQPCRGVRMIVTDRKAMEPVRVGLAIALELHRSYPSQWDSSSFNTLPGSKATWDSVRARHELDRIEAQWQPELEAFKSRRAKHLLYK
jgi:uncharacterized protein YbbC (DUF1343 family)